MDYGKRREKLRVKLAEQESDALLVSKWANIHYLSGFTGDDSMLLVTRKRDYLLTDFRYVEQAQEECPGIGIADRRKRSLVQLAVEKLKRLGLGSLSFEPASTSYEQYRGLRKHALNVKLKAAPLLVEKLRMIKDADELALICQAVKVAEKALTSLRRHIRPGVMERELATELEFRLRRLGARAAFDVIVAFGARSSLPHARTTDRKLKAGEPMLIDWGARLGSYNSDLTRVFFAGRVPRKFRRIYEVVAEAQSQALAALAVGKAIGIADRKARIVIRKAGFGRRFGHALGHGVGLEVHEAPTVRSRNDEVLEPGMVFTVEPGIYIPGLGGVRIEDVVVIRAAGAEVLTSFEKRLERMVI